MAEQTAMTGKSLAFYLADDTATTGYWCIRTMGPIGPDDGFVCPGDCGPQRVCYEPNIKPPA